MSESRSLPSQFVPDGRAVLLAAVLLAVPGVIGWFAATDVRFPVRREVLLGWDPGLALGILGQNLAVAATLFSGVSTAAVSTLVAVPVLGIYLGVVVRGACTALGAADAAAVLGPFVTVEVAAFVLAAAAGIAPMLSALARWRSRTAACSTHRERVSGGVTGYLHAAARSAIQLPVIAVLLAAAAVLETLGGVPA